jgi:mono/diheme cytochrome c family protein
MVKACKLFFLLLLVLVIAGAIYAWRLKRRGFSARNQPSAVETVVARTMRNMAIPASARNEENPWKDLDNAANRKEAREHWADHCAFCHGNDGSGNTDTGKNMYPKPPDMRLAATQNLTDGELYYIIENGVRLTGMPAWGDARFIDQDDDTWKIVLFIRHLPNLTPEDLQDMKDYNPKGKMEEEEDDDSNALPKMKNMPDMPNMPGMHHTEPDTDHTKH